MLQDQALMLSIGCFGGAICYHKITVVLGTSTSACMIGWIPDGRTVNVQDMSYALTNVGT